MCIILKVMNRDTGIAICIVSSRRRIVSALLQPINFLPRPISYCENRNTAFFRKTWDQLQSMLWLQLQIKLHPFLDVVDYDYNYFEM
jgi:hypothetical protein